MATTKAKVTPKAKTVTRSQPASHKKGAAPAYPPPQSIDEAARYNLLAARHCAMGLEAEVEFARKIAPLRAKTQKTFASHIAQAKELARAAYEYAKENRIDLTGGDLYKTVDLPNAGSFNWFKPSSSIVVDDEEKTIEMLEALQLSRFIRIKREVDKEALERAPEILAQLQGVHVEEGKELFFLNPPDVAVKLQRVVEGKDVWKLVRPPKKEPIAEE